MPCAVSRNATEKIPADADVTSGVSEMDHVLRTSDGGATWTLSPGLSGFRSVVAHLPGGDRSWIAVGPQGADSTGDDGRTWTKLEGGGYHAFSFAPKSRVGWGVGESGRIGRLVW